MGCEDHLDREQEALERAAERGDAAEYYARATRDGESPGRWTGELLSALGLAEGEHVTEERARRLLAYLQNPVTGEQLGRAPISTDGVADQFRGWLKENPEATAEERREQFNYLVDSKRTSVGFFDATHSAPKSVSVYEAALRQVGRTEEADAVLRAHRDAVAAANRELEAHTYTRVWDNDRGTQVYEHVGKVAAIEFDHSTSREQDPQLHCHSAIANRVQAHNGKWMSIANRAWNPVKAQVAAVYERTLAEQIEQHTSARMVLRADGMGREIAGVSQEVLDESSTRTRQVEEHLDEAVKRFKAQNGRAPTAKEKGKLHRQAGLQSRPGKSHATPDEQLHRWADRIDTASVVSSVDAAGRDIDEYGRPDAEATVTITDDLSRARAIRQAVATCQSRAATFTPGELFAELDRVVAPDGRSASEMRALLSELQNEARDDPDYGVLDISRPEPIEIGWWREQSTGLAIWRDPGEKGVLTTRSQMSTEKEVVRTARQRRRGGRALDEASLRQAEEELDAAGLSSDQRDVVMHVLSSERVADAVAAPAGTGKSFTMGQLASQWERRAHGSVLGLATSQRAAEVLAEDGIRAMNTTQFLQRFEPDSDGQEPALRLQRGDLLVLDESSMSSTSEIARIQRIAHEAGAKMVYTGDPQQLQAIGPGGMFGLVGRENGAAELEQVHRFREEWEKDASLRLRDGQLDAVDEYVERGRVAMGTAEEMRQKAAQSYVADIAQGRSSLLIAATHGEAAEVGERVQRLLQQTGQVPDQPVAELADGNTANVGDLVLATRNHRHVDCADGITQITNKERYRVVDSWSDGGVIVQREDGGGRAWIPAEYVAEHLQLGYAGTEHAAQGVTVDRGHTLVAGYVGMTRGKESNHAWLTSFSAADAEDPGMQRGAREAFAERGIDGVGTAVETMRREIDAAHSTGELLRIWEHMSRETALDRHRDALLHHLGADQTERIEFDPGSATFYDTLRRAEMAGHDVDELLPRVVAEKSFNRVGDLSAVLTKRLERHIDEPETSGWSWAAATPGGAGRLSEQHREVAGLLDEREAKLGRQAWEEQPQWAVDALGPPPMGTAGEQEEWTRRAGTLAAWREVAGITREDTGLGRAPETSDWLRRTAWMRAARAVEAEPERIEVQSASEHDLRAWIAEADREATWAPEYVAEDLGRARSLVSRYADEAIVQRERAAAATDDQQRERFEAAAAEAENRRAVMAGRVDALAQVDQVRREWLQATESTRARARAAREELAKREPEPQEVERQPEQVGLWSAKALLPIETPHENADQAEWLQAHYAEQHSYRRLLQYQHGEDEGDRRWQEQQERARREQAAESLAGARPERDPVAGPERVTVAEDRDREAAHSGRVVVPDGAGADWAQSRAEQREWEMLTEIHGSEEGERLWRQRWRDEQQEQSAEQEALFDWDEVASTGHRHQAEADAVHVTEDQLETGDQADRTGMSDRTVGEAQRAAWATQRHLQAMRQRREHEAEEMRQYEQAQAQAQAQQQEQVERTL